MVVKHGNESHGRIRKKSPTKQTKDEEFIMIHPQKDDTNLMVPIASLYVCTFGPKNKP